jgi:hypothetical protein
MASNQDDIHRVVHVPAPSVLWLADPPQPPHLAIPPLRAVLPRFMTIASEISLDKKGRLVLGRATSAGLGQRKLLEPFDDIQRSSYPLNNYASTLIKGYLSCRNEYKKPFTRPIVVEERRKGQDMQNPPTISEVQATFFYAEASDKQYPRGGQDFGRRLDILPSFEFPEIIMNACDVKDNDGRWVFAADKTKTLLEHLILRVDINDSLISDLECLLTLPSKNEPPAKGKAKVKAKAKVKSRELVQSHLNHGRWVWITERFMETPWRNVLACQSADLMDARLAYWQWGDDLRRMDIIRTAIKGYPLVCGEYEIMEKDLGICCMAPKLDVYFHHPRGLSLETILAVERFGWANLGGPTALAEEISLQMRETSGIPDENLTTKPRRFFRFSLNPSQLLTARRVVNQRIDNREIGNGKIDSGKIGSGKSDNGTKGEIIAADCFPWIENEWYIDTTCPTAIGFVPEPEPIVPCLPKTSGRKKQVCWCNNPCASASGVGPLYVLEEISFDEASSDKISSDKTSDDETSSDETSSDETSSYDTRPEGVFDVSLGHARLSEKKELQEATNKPVVTTASLPVAATPPKPRRTLTEANNGVVSSASRVKGNFIQLRKAFDDISFSLPKRNEKSEEVKSECSSLRLSVQSA